MKMYLESTTKIVEVDGVEMRIWEGRTGEGIEIHAFVHRVAVRATEDQGQFERELAGRPAREPRDPDVVAYPARLIL